MLLFQWTFHVRKALAATITVAATAIMIDVSRFEWRFGPGISAGFAEITAGGTSTAAFPTSADSTCPTGDLSAMTTGAVVSIG